MKSEKLIQERIDGYFKSIEKFKNDNTLDVVKKNSAIFKLQTLIRELKWILN